MKAGRIILIGCAWAVVYGLLNGISNIFVMPSASVISLRPQIALPMALGIIVHPWAGFVSGVIGNILGDGLSGFGFWKFWNWHLANGLMGCLPGLIRYGGITRIGTVRDFGVLQMSIVAASAVAVGSAVLLDIGFLHFLEFPSSLHAWILPAFLTDAVNGFILVPVILAFSRRMQMTLEIRTILLVTTLLLTAVLITASAITWVNMDDLVSREAVVENFYAAGIVIVFLLVAGFLVAIRFVRKFTDPVIRLTGAAEAVEKGNYDTSGLEAVSARKDELGRLSRVFQEMAGKIQEREKRLQRQVEELRIKIDRKRQAEEVAEIVETDYFRELKKKAKEFRES